MSSEFVLQLLLIVATGGGVYAAIRADLALALHHAKEAVDSAQKAHERLSSHIEVHHTRAV